VQGWGLIGAAAAFSLMLALGPTAPPKGVPSFGLALASFFGLGCLLFARKEFECQRGPPASKIPGKRKVLPAALAALGACALFCSCEVVGGDAARTRRVRGAVALMCAAAVYSQGCARLRVEGYALFAPLSGGPSFMVLQAEAWLLFGGVVHTALVATREPLTRSGAVAEQVRSMPRGGFVILGMAQLAANALVELSPVVFEGARPVKSGACAAKASAGAPAARRRWASVASLCLWALALLLTLWAAAVLLSPAHGTLARRRAVAALFLSAPLCHGASAFAHAHSIYQPLAGGVGYVIVQGYAWTLYGAATTLAVVGKMHDVGIAHADHTVPMLFFSAVLIAASTMVFEDTAVAHSQSHAPPQSAPRLATSAAFYDVPTGACASAVAACCAVAYGLGGLDSAEACGLTILVSATAATVAGFHLVFTHYWLLLAGCATLMQAPALTSTLAVLGVNISLVWYLSLLRQSELLIPARAVIGWAVWCYDVVGAAAPVSPVGAALSRWGLHRAEFIERVSWEPIQSVFSGFALLDIGLHLVPTLILLRLGADRISLDSVAGAYCIARAWSLAVTCHHFRIDVRSLRERSLAVIRLERYSQPPTMWATYGSVNQIYGFQPPAPPAFFQHAATVEFYATAACTAICCLPKETKSAVFHALGGSVFVSVDSLLLTVVACCSLGLGTIVVGAAIASNMAEPRAAAETDPVRRLKAASETAEVSLRKAEQPSRRRCHVEAPR